MFRFRFLAMAAAAFAAALAAPSASRAAFTFTLDVNGTVITDGGAGDSDGLVNGHIGYSNANLGGYNIVSISVTTTSPNSGFGDIYSLSQSTDIKSNGNTLHAPLVITVFSDGFVGGPSLMALTNSLADSKFDRGSATGTSTITPPGGVAGTTPTATVTSPGAHSSTTTSASVSGNPFALSNTLTLTGLAGNNAEFNGSLTTEAVQATPAPSALLLGLLGLPAFGLLRRHFRAGGAELATAA